MSRARGIKRQPTQEMILDPQRRVRELIEMGSSVKVDKAVPVKRYFRSGSEMERQARVYYAEGQLDKAFILYNKFVTLFLEKLPKHHPEYSKPEYKPDRAKIKKLVKEAFPRAEELKKKLTSQFESEKAALEEKLAEEAERRQKEEQLAAEELAAEQRRREEEERRCREENEKKEREQAEKLAAFLASSTVSSEMIGENRSGSVGSDQTSPAAPSSTNYEENSPNTKRDLETGQNRLTGGEEEQITSTMATLAIDTCPPQHQVSPSRHNEMRPEGISLTATKVELAQVLPPTYEGPSPSNQNTTAQPLASDSPHLQTPMSSVRTYQSIFSGPVTPTQSPQMAPPNYSDPPPPINPYYTSMGGQGAQIPPGTYYQPYYTPAQVYQPPPHPAVGGYTSQFSTASSSSWGSVELPAPSYHMTPPSTLPPYQEEETEPSNGPPSFDRSNKPNYNALSTSIGGGYRMVYVPESISSKFEEAASANTRQNIETCAILAGKLSRNQLHITHMILPKQRGGPDSCETLSEEELFDVQDQHDLITLGWIHTHPSQTAFMSSVDLHTHCSYQIMLDEAIAIVCAPRYSQVGVYMLTEPYGLDYITHCEEEGFHTHPKEPPLYEECKHVIFSQSPVNIVDLR